MLSKQDVVLYINEEKVSKCDTNGQCDTNSKDNVGPMLKLLTHRTHSVFELLIFYLLKYVENCPKGNIEKPARSSGVKKIINIHLYETIKFAFNTHPLLL